MSTGSRIRTAREAKGFTLDDLGIRCGTTRQTIFKYETGLITNIPLDRIEKIASVLGVSPAYLTGWEDTAEPIPGILPLPANKAYPLVGNIACGTPILAEENITEYIQFPGDLNADFCLRCRGDSMIDARIHDGDIVFIRQQPEVANGEIAAVQICEEAATLKRVYRSEDGSTLTLMAANPAYPPMVYSGEQLASVRILGKAVNFLSTVK